MNGRRIRVAVIGGGQNCEHEVSLASAAAATAALDSDRYHVVSLTIGRDGEWRDEGDHPLSLPAVIQTLRGCDVALPMVHGPRGEDGTLAALLDLAGVPYAGSGLTAGAVAMDKWLTKLVAQAIGLAVAPGVLLTGATAGSYTWTHPVVVKPVSSGSSQGVTRVDRPEQLAAAIDAALALDQRVLVEDVIEGREVDLAVLARADGSRIVAPALEIVVSGGVFDYETKYGGSAVFQVPAPLSEADRKALEHAALAMFDALGCRGVARVDFFLTPEGPVLNEVNTMPGFTSQSQVPRMFAAAGTPYPALLDILIADALASAS